MSHSIAFIAKDFDILKKEIFDFSGLEGAAFLFCGESVSNERVTLIAREIFPITKEHYLSRKHDGLSIDSQAYVNAVKRALRNKATIIFVHSHPGEFKDFSQRDEKELLKLHKFFSARMPDRHHGSLILTKEVKFSGRVWFNNKWSEIDKLKIIGKRFKFLSSDNPKPISDFFDRQVLVFGNKIQESLQNIHIGIVGAGGTGSCVAEQVARLGVGQISIFDDDKLEKSNMSRVFGSTLKDVGKNKAEILANHIKNIEIGTSVNAYPKSICEKDTAMKLRDCDVIFGCSDTHSSRGIITRLSHYYFIPFIDLAVLVNSSGGIIQEIVGRVTTVFPGEACLFCRDRIKPEIITLEGMTEKERKRLVSEKYAPELDTDDPSVITFTAEVACQGVTELIHRIADFKGSDYNSTEMLMFFDKNSIRTNTVPPKDNCLCMREENLGIGDKRDFLGLIWQK